MNKTTYDQPMDARLPMEEAKMSRSEALATRLEAGASALAALANTLSEAEWQTRLPKDGRKVGVVVHHVASVYPVEIHLASLLASGQPIAGVSWDAIHTMNSDHATGNDGATRSDTLALLASNSAAAAAAIRAARHAPAGLVGPHPGAVRESRSRLRRLARVRARPASWMAPSPKCD